MAKIKLKPNKMNTVIEFSPNSIKLVQYLIKKDLVTNLFIKYPIGDSEEEFINALNEIIKTNNLKIDNLLISLDRSMASTRFVKLPVIDENEIKQMAQWQAAKILPFNFDELVVSYKKVKVDSEGFSYVILAAVPKNIVKKFINICNALKLNPQEITLSTEGLLRWYGKQKFNNDAEEPLAVIDIDKNKAELAIIHEDKLIFSRSLFLNLPKDGGLIKSRIDEELRLSLEFYKRQEISPEIKNIILTGESSYILELSSTLNIGLPIESIDNLRNFNLAESIDIKNIACGISLASLLGFTAGETHPEIDLMPQELKDREAYLGKKKEFLKTSCLVLFAILVFFGAASLNFYYKNEIIKKLDKQIGEMNTIVKEASDMNKKITLINSYFNNQNSPIEIIREIHKIIPEGVYLDNFIFEEENQVVLKGNSSSMPSVFKFVSILNESPLFRDVKLKYVTQRKNKSQEITNFEVICKLTPENNK